MRRGFRYLFGIVDEDEEDIPVFTGEGSIVAKREETQEPTLERQKLQRTIESSVGNITRVRKNDSVQVKRITTPGYIQQREMYGRISKNQNKWIGHSFIPSHGTVVAKSPQQIFSGIFSRDGSEFVSASQDRSLKVYDVNTWEINEDFPALEFGWAVLDVDYVDDLIVYSTWSSSLCLHRRNERHQESLELGDGRFGIFSVEFSEDKKLIAASGSDISVYIYGLEENRVQDKIEAHENHVNAIKWLDGSGNLILSGSDDGLIKLWDRRDYRNHMPVSSFVGHLDGISNLDVMESDPYFLSNSKDQSIKLWDLRVYTSPTNAIPPPESYWDYRYGEQSLHRSEKEFRSGKYVHRQDNSIHSYRGHSVFNTLIRARFSPASMTGNRYIYTGSAHQPYSVYIFDVTTGDIVEELDGHSSIVRDVSWNPNYPQIVSVGWDGNIIKWDC